MMFSIGNLSTRAPIIATEDVDMGTTGESVWVIFLAFTSGIAVGGTLFLLVDVVLV